MFLFLTHRDNKIRAMRIDTNSIIMDTQKDVLLISNIKTITLMIIESIIMLILRIIDGKIIITTKINKSIMMEDITVKGINTKNQETNKCKIKEIMTIKGLKDNKTIDNIIKIKKNTTKEKSNTMIFTVMKHRRHTRNIKENIIHKIKKNKYPSITNMIFLAKMKTINKKEIR